MNTNTVKSVGRYFAAYLVMGLVLGFGNAAPTPNGKPDPAQVKARREARQEAKLNRLAQELNLNPNQKEQVKAILKQEKEQRRAVVQESMNAAKPKLEAVREQTSGKLKGVLNAQQYAQYEARRKERLERRTQAKTNPKNA